MSSNNVVLNKLETLARRERRRYFNKPPQGYYLLKPGEIIEQTDLFHNGKTWIPCQLIGQPVKCAWIARRIKNESK